MMLTDVQLLEIEAVDEVDAGKRRRLLGHLTVAIILAWDVMV